MRLFDWIGGTPGEAQLSAPDLPAAALAWPGKQQTVADTPILSLDFETTGLNPVEDHIVSLGWVLIEDGALHLGTARHQMVRAPSDRAHLNSEIHGLTHTQVEDGLALKEALSLLLQALDGHVLLAHHAPIELGFLAQASPQLRAGLKAWPVIDTMATAHQVFQRLGRAPRPDGLRLSSLREDHGLPHRRLHNACVDAMSTAEVFLAQVAKAGGLSIPVRDMLRPGHAYL